MALQSSGAISLNQIHVEAGGTTETTASINDTDIRALISKASEAAMSFSEWYGASSGSSTTHETSFKPVFTVETISFIGVTTQKSGAGHTAAATFTDATFPNSGTFSDGTSTYSANGITITEFVAFELFSQGSSSQGPQYINLHMENSSSSGGPANGGWTKIEAYANTSGTGTPLLSFNRTDATFQAVNSGSFQYSSWSWEAPSGASFSNLFGTDTSAPSSPTHLIKIIQ